MGDEAYSARTSTSVWPGPRSSRALLEADGVTAVPALARLDAQLFTGRGWFLIDRSNRRVRSVMPSSLTDGLARVDRGEAAAVVGHLRAPFRVVDVDVEGDCACRIVEELELWATSRQLWFLIRPSGGAAGRTHVFIRPGAAEDELRLVLDTIRERDGLPYAAVALLRTVRPLSSPHRTGVRTRPRGPLKPLLARLHAGRPTLLPVEAAGRRPPPRGVSATSGMRSRSTTTSAALVPRPRRPRPVPEPWLRYLRDGTAPALGGGDLSSSTYTLVATGHLLRAGLDVEAAWSAVAMSHPDACTHGKQQGRRWWVRHMWNHEVRHADEELAGGRPDAANDPVLAAQVAAARASLTALAYRCGPRARHGVLAVAHALLDRMLRQQQTTVPCPLRDLLLDCGVRDLRTISAALRRLQDERFGTYNEVFDPSTPSSSSHTFTLAQHHQPPLAAAVAGTAGGSLLEDPTPSFHTPSPAPSPPPGTWSHLPLAAHSLWRALSTSPAVSAPELGARAGLSRSPLAAPSAQQLRTVNAHLAMLASAGLACCDANGDWFAVNAFDPVMTAAAAATYRVLVVKVQAERVNYRGRSGSDWQRQRAAAVARSRHQAAQRQQRWWRELPAHDRESRQAHYAHRFSRLSVHDQGRLKSELAHRRTALGIDEASRHDRWIEHLGDREYRDRSVLRAAWFSQQPRPLQVAYAQQWGGHRAAFRVPAGPPRHVKIRSEFVELADGSTGSDARDERYLRHEQSQMQLRDDGRGLSA